MQFDGALLSKAYKDLEENEQKSYPFCPKYVKVYMKKYRRLTSHDTDEWCKVWRKTDSWFQKWHEEFGVFYASSGKSENLHFDMLLLSTAYKVSAKILQKNCVSWHWRVIQTLKKHCLKNDMRNLVSFNASSRKSENLHFDGFLI